MVEWKKLGDLLDYEQPTSYLVNSTEYDESYDVPVLTAGQSLLLGYTNETEGIYQASKTNPTIIFDDFTTSFHWIDYKFKVKSSAMKMLRPKKDVNFRYVYYAMLGINFVPGGHQRHWISKYSNFEIPIPSLSEQSRIVSLLDTFTSSISNLKQQIEERRKQYEYERDLLLDLEGKEGVEWKRLSEICEIKGEYGLSVPSKPFDGVRYIRITDITDDGKLNSDCVSADYNEITKVPLEEGDLLFARTGATVGKTLMYLKEYGKCLYAGYLIRYRVNREVVLPKYVFHFTHSNKYNLWVKSNLVEGAQPNINAQKYNSLEIPIPSHSEQSRIVSILDTFEQSISNLEEQLAMREKQYEYYRNQLLTFEGEEERGKT